MWPKKKKLFSKQILLEEGIRFPAGCWDKGESSRTSHIGREKEKQVVIAASVYRGFLGAKPYAKGDSQMITFHLRTAQWCRHH